MDSPPRQLPRFLPTLTEVVRPSEMSAEAPASQPDPEAFVQTLLAQVDVLVKTRVQEELESLIRSVLVEHTQALVPSLQLKLHEEVRKMVLDTLASQDEPNKFKS